MYFDGIILECVKRIKENRSISGVFHLLKGKKSIQSVQDARIFRLEQFYGIYQSLSKEQFFDKVMELTSNGILENGQSEGMYRLTEMGNELLKIYYESIPFSYFKGLIYTGKDVTFLERVYLLIQTLSNTQVDNYSFIPVIDKPAITSWVKLFYKEAKDSNVNVSIKLHEELHDLLKHLKEKEAELFVDRFSGYRYYGMSIDQIAEKHQLSRDDTVVYLTAVTHQIMSRIESEPEHYRILSSLIQDSNHNMFITNTANQTYQLLKHQYNIAEIANQRRLKLNTIYDHIVEIALYDEDFHIESFVSKQEQEQIIAAIRRESTYKLKTIKANCNPSISYFQIRLVLSKNKDLLPEDGVYD